MLASSIRISCTFPLRHAARSLHRNGNWSLRSTGGSWGYRFCSVFSESFSIEIFRALHSDSSNRDLNVSSEDFENFACICDAIVVREKAKRDWTNNEWRLRQTFLTREVARMSFHRRKIWRFWFVSDISDWSMYLESYTKLCFRSKERSLKF